MTCHPKALSARRWRPSRALFPAILSNQKSAFDFGRDDMAHV